MYAVVDVETTGLSPSAEKITEIAIYIHDGEQLVDEFQTLVNPEKKIPYRIVQMTGINNTMVQDAPKFYEIAKDIVALTEGNILVGHNVRFDYNFIRNEFRSFGYDFRRKTLDTVRLSRKLIPGLPGYSLSALCAHLGIKNPARHRAAGDAWATAQLLNLLLSIEKRPEEVALNGYGSDVSKSLVSKLPNETGVYYFYSRQGQLNYVGKSVHIRDRVLAHLNNNLHKRAVEMKADISEVTYEVTGSELVALLLESAEIKKHQPFYNRAQRRTFFNYGLYFFTDDGGYRNLKLSRILDELPPVYTYSSLQEGKEHLFHLTERFGLCQKLCGVYHTKGACFHYQIHQCNGACIGEEQPEIYNERVKEALENYHFGNDSFFIIGKGRKQGEQSVVKIESGKYIGFGYTAAESISPSDLSACHDCIRSKNDNREVRQIINAYIKKNDDLIISY